MYLHFVIGILVQHCDLPFRIKNSRNHFGSYENANEKLDF